MLGLWSQTAWGLMESCDLEQFSWDFSVPISKMLIRRLVPTRKVAIRVKGIGTGEACGTVFGTW